MCSSLSSLVIEYVGPVDEEPPANPDLPTTKSLGTIDWAVATPAEIGRLVDNLEQKLATEPWKIPTPSNPKPLTPYGVVEIPMPVEKKAKPSSSESSSVQTEPRRLERRRAKNEDVPADAVALFEAWGQKVRDDDTKKKQEKIGQAKMTAPWRQKMEEDGKLRFFPKPKYSVSNTSVPKPTAAENPAEDSEDPSEKAAADPEVPYK